MNKVSAIIQNNASAGLYLSADPNWDGQILFVNGKRMHGGSFLIEPGLSATASVGWDDSPPAEYMMGIIISEDENPDYGKGGSFQLTIGLDPSTKKMAVTDPEPYTSGSPKESYIVTAQTEWSLTLVFSDN